MYSTRCSGVVKKKSFDFIEQNFESCNLWSEITLLIRIFVSIDDTVGDAILSGYSSQSPPTVIPTLIFSVFK